MIALYVWLLQETTGGGAAQGAAAVAPGINPIFAALLGALVGALSAQGLREFFDRKQRQKELSGILRLLDLESYAHRQQLDHYQSTPSWITDAPAYTLRFTAWDKSNTRLAQLLRDDTEFADIAKYYENMRGIDEFRRASEDKTWRQERITRLLPTLFELHELTRKHIRKHVQNATTGTPLESIRGEARDTGT